MLQNNTLVEFYREKAIDVASWILMITATNRFPHTIQGLLKSSNRITSF